MTEWGPQPFPVLPTRVDTRSETFQTNKSAQLERLEVIEEGLKQSRAGGGEKYNTRHKDRGKLLPRERVELLLDRERPCVQEGVFLGGWIEVPRASHQVVVRVKEGRGDGRRARARRWGDGGAALHGPRVG